MTHHIDPGVKVLEAAIVDGYPWVNPPWGDPVNATMLEDFRGGLVDSLHRHGLVITTRARFDELKSKEMAYEPIVRGLVDYAHKQPEFVAALMRHEHQWEVDPVSGLSGCLTCGVTR